MIAREDRGRARDLLVALFDEFLENLRARPEARIDLGEGVLAVGMPNDEVTDALQKDEKREKREKKPAPKTAKVQSQG